jgi:hypothetical protein
VSRRRSGRFFDEASKLAERENAKRLNSCAQHDFESIPDLQSDQSDQRFVCKKCGGRLDVVSVIWYQLGLEHARQRISAAAWDLSPK